MPENPGGLRQLLSAGAVVLSLLFVGLEVQRNTVAQRAQTRQALADASREFLLTLVENPELWDAWVGRWSFETPTLTPSDSLKAETALRALVRNAENVYLQHREGAIDESALQTYGFSGTVWQLPTIQEFWRTRMRAQWDTSFVRAFEEANGMR